ncbi:MAG: thermonuclease family protein [Brachybacterium sp.]|uniref:thermonuclease family protein n=1 Tax=Brachybacterium sp. TaxID=1891286 RepID=UPI00264730E0|nr:thermonuclease family protein [Brachybacterium sp.]MDN5685855.1 thermonuclease family protein [Brachybacterium sp.]
MRTDHRQEAPWAAAALLGVILVGAAACEPIEELEPAPLAEGYAVAYVIDGDTIEVTGPEGETQRVRLLGINTPEVAHDGDAGQCGGEKATEQLEELLPEGTAVQLVTDDRADDEDRYDRLLRYVETEGGTDAGHALITEGYAYAWAPTSEPDPERINEYEDATATARDADAGAWADCPNLGESR